MSHHGAYVRALDGQCVSLRESCNIDRPVVLECRRYLCSVGLWVATHTWTSRVLYHLGRHMFCNPGARKKHHLNAQQSMTD